mmetsp:Transcript_9921/g.30595  ORF Transcript_9921/g.30595 Transcript_9921/m.30595 type:complete len:210 (+) Transcript_9921:174-803(+)
MLSTTAHRVSHTERGFPVGAHQPKHYGNCSSRGTTRLPGCSVFLSTRPSQAPVAWDSKLSLGGLKSSTLRFPVIWMDFRGEPPVRCGIWWSALLVIARHPKSEITFSVAVKRWSALTSARVRCCVTSARSRSADALRSNFSVFLRPSKRSATGYSPSAQSSSMSTSGHARRCAASALRCSPRVPRSNQCSFRRAWQSSATRRYLKDRVS